MVKEKNTWLVPTDIEWQPDTSTNIDYTVGSGTTDQSTNTNVDANATGGENKPGMQSFLICNVPDFECDGCSEIQKSLREQQFEPLSAFVVENIQLSGGAVTELRHCGISLRLRQVNLEHSAKRMNLLTIFARFRLTLPPALHYFVEHALDDAMTLPPTTTPTPHRLSDRRDKSVVT
ncbi:hypothetical protein Pelo_4129 [Pelomyxa schiedti]|nr:hypothetical protein Pelo_4129 [Pelomyxa schiedti]